MRRCPGLATLMPLDRAATHEHQLTQVEGWARIDINMFRSIFSDHATGVTIITLSDGSGPRGFTASSVISVAAWPPLIAFSISRSCSVAPVLDAASTLVVNFLGGEHADLARRFAHSGIDRFDGVEWRTTASDDPFLLCAAAWMRCRIRQRHEAGPSDLVVVEAVDGGQSPYAQAGLVYRNRGFYALQGTELDESWRSG